MDALSLRDEEDKLVKEVKDMDAQGELIIGNVVGAGHIAKEIDIVRKLHQ